MAMFLTFVGGMSTLICATIIGVLLIKRRPAKRAEDLNAALGDISERLSRLDVSIETMAIEIERISEAQRFTARVLSERHSPAALPEKSRGTITPH
jgi:Tfp pilus assembly protein PilN